jgi:fructosamine-3-kinase
VWRVRLANGRAAVVKATPYPADIEAEGLLALGAADAPVPAVLGVGDRVLVLAHVAGTPDWAGVGHKLAALHRHVAETGRFGWCRDNLIGPLPQRNGWIGSWPVFYAERRIRPLLDAPALPPRQRRRLEAALDGPLQELLDSAPPASLIHGDLWSGNVVDGRWLIDPAVCYADREHELAFMTVFGGFPPALFEAYEAAWPLVDGWQRRRPALQLYHLLVHVRLFGAGYVGAVSARLDQLGW